MRTLRFLASLVWVIGAIVAMLYARQAHAIIGPVMTYIVVMLVPTYIYRQRWGGQHEPA